MGSIWHGLQSILGGIVAFFYGLIPNLGVAIILLTLVVGLVLFPLTLKQTRSMRAMQEIQPLVKKLQAEYKNDRQVLQEKTMELYRERGVNPAAGCLPIILQMPIWFALFSVLRSFAGTDPTKFVPEGSNLFLAISEKVADTTSHILDFLWMDLTITPRDAFAISFQHALPYLITIVIVMITAYWQQKQTMARSAKTRPDQPAPPGQAIMKIFPLFFGFISFTLPAGLVVYFAASQAFRIGQQAVIIGMDDRKAEEEGGSTDTPAKSVKPKEIKPKQAKPVAESSDSPKGQAPPAKRRPQGSKKKRGKRRRR